MSFLKKWRLVLGVGLCAFAGVMANAYLNKISFARGYMPATQDVRSLDRRISSLEQSIYSIEASIGRLQQSVLSQRPPVPQSSSRDQQIDLLRAEIRALQLRLSEIERGLVKLDQRTASAAVREVHGTDRAKASDPCRVNPETPVHLSNRP